MSHEVETMAYAHAVPWHGLGVPVTPDLTPAQMGEAAGLNWTVSKRPIFASSFTPAPDLAPSQGSIPVKGQFALTRDSDDKVFGVVGERWNPVQNEQVLDFFKRFCAEGGATMETAGALRGGEIVWALANLGDGFKLPGGDAVKGYLLLASRHQSGYATVARVTPVRVVCANTLALSGGFGKAGANQVRVPHYLKFDPAAAAEAVGVAHEGMTEFGRNARLLQKLNLSREDAVRILAPVYDDKLIADTGSRPGYFGHVLSDPLVDGWAEKANRTVKGIMEAALRGPGADVAGQTGWGWLNAATYYANHKARGSADARFSSTTLGKNNDDLNRVYGKILQLADA